MLIYHYHPDNGAYLGSSTADPDPAELTEARSAQFELVAGPARAAFVAAREALDPDDTEGLAQLQATLQAAMGAASVAAEAVEPAHWLIPAHASDVTPPPCADDEQVVMTSEGWSIRPKPQVEPEDEADPVAAADQVRALRTARIAAVRWLIDRHRDEAALGLSTTLTTEDYLLVLQYVQDLRDVPEQAGFPDAVIWPTLAQELLATGD